MLSVRARDIASSELSMVTRLRRGISSPGGCKLSPDKSADQSSWRRRGVLLAEFGMGGYCEARERSLECECNESSPSSSSSSGSMMAVAVIPASSMSCGPLKEVMNKRPNPYARVGLTGK